MANNLSTSKEEIFYDGEGHDDDCRGARWNEKNRYDWDDHDENEEF